MIRLPHSLDTALAIAVFELSCSERRHAPPSLILGQIRESPASAATRLADEYHAGKLSLDELRAKEVAVGTADAECFVATDLGRSRRAAESRTEEELLAQNSETLLAMKGARDDAIVRAEAVLGNPDL